MTSRVRYEDGEYGLAAMVLSECMRDFRKAVREWKRNLCEKTKKEVNRTHAVVIRNQFAPYVPVDLHEACRKAYREEMGGENDHKKAAGEYTVYPPKD